MKYRLLGESGLRVSEAALAINYSLTNFRPFQHGIDTRCG
jgi:hypothetical protein